MVSLIYSTRNEIREKNIKITKNKQTPVLSAHLVQKKSKIRERGRNGTRKMEERICERDGF